MMKKSSNRGRTVCVKDGEVGKETSASGLWEGGAERMKEAGI